MALKELLVSFGIEVDSKDLTGLQGKITGLVDGLKKVGGVLMGGAVVKGFVDFIKTQVDAADALNDTSARLGVAAEDLQRYEYAAKMAGIESGAAGAALGIFNKQIGEAAGGNKGAIEAFSALGVSVKDANGEVGSTLGLLDVVAEGLKDLNSPQEKAAALMKLFGKQGAALAPMLEGGAAGLQEMYDQLEKTGGLLDQEYLDNVAKAGDAMDDFGYATRGAKAQITAGLLPAFTWLVKKGTELIGSFVRLAKETNGVGNMMKILGIAGAGFLVLKFSNLIKTAGGLNKALKSAFNLGVKEMVIIGSIIVLLLLLEDLVTFIQGGDSVIGDFFEKFMGHEEALAFAQQLRDIWAEVGDSFKTVGPQLANIMTQLGPVAAQAIPVLVKGLVQVIKLVSAGAALLGGFVSGIGAIADGKGFQGFQDAAMKAGDTVFGKQTSFVDPKTGEVTTKNVGGLYGEAVPSPPPGAAAGAGGSTTNQVTQTNQTTINVDGSKDPLATADAVAQKQNRVNDQANRNALGAVKVTK